MSSSCEGAEPWYKASLILFACLLFLLSIAFVILREERRYSVRPATAPPATPRAPPPPFVVVIGPDASSVGIATA
jgi:hypothetical protein